jgi:hypothetical protein
MKFLSAILFVLGLSFPVLADAVKAGDLEIDKVWARATLRTGAPTGAFLGIRNTGMAADRLISASSPLAKTVEIHLSTMTDGVMKMRRTPHVDIPAGKMVMLQPGGFHIMLMGMTKAIKAGAHVPLTLTFERAGQVTVQADVKAMGKAPKHKMKHKMKHSN